VNRASRAREVFELAGPSTEARKHPGFACIEAYLSRRRSSHPTEAPDLIRRGEIDSITIGRRRLILVESLKKLIERAEHAREGAGSIVTEIAAADARSHMPSS
jgi:hypothetical protein